MDTSESTPGIFTPSTPTTPDTFTPSTPPPRLQRMGSKLPNLYLYIGHGSIYCMGSDLLSDTVPANTIIVNTTSAGNVGSFNDEEFIPHLFKKSALPILYNPSNIKPLRKLLNLGGANLVPHVTNPGEKYIIGSFYPLAYSQSNQQRINNKCTLALSGIHHRNSCFKNPDGTVNQLNFDRITCTINSENEYNLPLNRDVILSKFLCSAKPTIEDVDNKITKLYGANKKQLNADEIVNLGNELSFPTSSFINNHPGIHYLLICRVETQLPATEYLNADPDQTKRMCRQSTLIQRSSSALKHNSIFADLQNLLMTVENSRFKYVTETDIIRYLTDIYESIRYTDVSNTNSEFRKIYDFFHSLTMSMHNETPNIDNAWLLFDLNIINYIRLKKRIQDMNYAFERKPSDNSLLDKLNRTKELLNYYKKKILQAKQKVQEPSTSNTVNAEENVLPPNIFDGGKRRKTLKRKIRRNRKTIRRKH